MPTLPEFTEGQFNPTDADSTISVSDSVIGFQAPGTNAGDERRYTIDNLKKIINKNQTIYGDGVANSSEGGQISFCGSNAGGGNSVVAWNVDVQRKDATAGEQLRIFTPGGVGMFHFNQEGKLRIGCTDATPAVYDTCQLISYNRGTTQNLKTGNGRQWICTVNAGGVTQFTWGGTPQTFPTILAGDTICVGTTRMLEPRERLGWREVSAVDGANRVVTVPAIPNVQPNQSYMFFQEDPGLRIVGKDGDGDINRVEFSRDHATFNVKKLNVHVTDNEDRAEINIYGSSGATQSSAQLYLGQSDAHGFGMLYNGDDSPNEIGVGDDCCFFNRNQGTDYITMKCRYNNSNFRFRGMMRVNDDTFAQPAFALDVLGDIRASGNVIAQSDGRYKDNTSTIDNGLNKIKQLRGVSYIKKDTTQVDLGLVAQEIEQVLPEIVTTHKGMKYADEKSVNYNGVIPVLIEAIKEQQQQIEELQKSISQ